MKILFVPMACMGETAGPMTRTAALAAAFQRAGAETGLCAASDPNYRPVPGAEEFHFSAPMPMGLPEFLGRRAFPMSEKLGIRRIKTVRSFEEVLHLCGALAYPYLKKSVEEIRSAIREFRPDAVYSEFNLSAVIAAKAEGLPIFCSYSYPTQPAYAASPEYAGGVKRLLKELGQAPVGSSLELFLRADARFVPSCPELEPIDVPGTYFCGFLKTVPELPDTADKRNIVVYMGSGTLSPKTALRALSGAFSHGKYQIYIAGGELEKSDIGCIHTAPRFDFSALLPGAAAFINHGGQNSVADGLMYGVPQIICPGRVFERKFNADSVVSNGAGVRLDTRDFTQAGLKKAADALSDGKCAENALRLRSRMIAAGGGPAAVRKVNALLDSVSRDPST